MLSSHGFSSLVGDTRLLIVLTPSAISWTKVQQTQNEKAELPETRTLFIIFLPLQKQLLKNTGDNHFEILTTSKETQEK